MTFYHGVKFEFVSFKEVFEFLSQCLICNSSLYLSWKFHDSEEHQSTDLLTDLLSLISFKWNPFSKPLDNTLLRHTFPLLNTSCFFFSCEIVTCSTALQKIYKLL